MTRAELLALLLAEQRGNLDQLAAEATDNPAAIRHRRAVLNAALTPRRSGRRPRTRLHRPRLILRHLEHEPRPWESRDALAEELFDRWAA